MEKVEMEKLCSAIALSETMMTDEDQPEPEPVPSQGIVSDESTQDEKVHLNEHDDKSSSGTPMDLFEEDSDTRSQEFLANEFLGVIPGVENDHEAFSLNVAKLLGMFSFLGVDAYSGPLSEIDLSLMTLFLDEQTLNNLTRLSQDIVNYVAFQVQLDTDESKLSRLMYGFALVSILAHESNEIDQLKNISLALSDIFKNFYLNLLDTGTDSCCSIIQVLRNIEQLTFNRYLRVQFLEVMVHFIAERLEQVRDPLRLEFMEQLIMVGLDLCQSLETEMFSATSDQRDDNPETHPCVNPPLHGIEISPMKFANMKPQGRIALKAQIESWVLELREVPVVQGTFSKYIFLIQERLNSILAQMDSMSLDQ